MTPLLLLSVGGTSGVVLVLAAWLMLRVSDKDILLAARISAAQGRWVKPDAMAPRRAAMQPLQRGLAALGQAVVKSGMLPVRTRAELQRSLSESGFRGSNALGLFIGGKMVLVLAGPSLCWMGANLLGLQPSTRVAMTAVGFIGGLLAPDMIVRKLRAGYLAKLEGGLPDALDLLVICTQAGLNLEAAMGRVAREMRLAQPALADELELTVRELEIMASAQAALASLAQRTGLETIKRLVSTLTQTMQYGTPLTDALRNLSAETRQSALTRFEARAARLPVMLTIPMILFILPCVFLIVGGPAVIQIMRAFSH